MRACAVFVLWATTTLTLPAQTFKTLHNFDNTDAALPRDDLGAGQRREFLRDNPERRKYCLQLGLWHGFQNQSKWLADRVQLRRDKRIAALRGFGPSRQRGLLRCNNRWRGLQWRHGLKFTPNGGLITLYSFNPNTGYGPQGAGSWPALWHDLQDNSEGQVHEAA